MAGRKGALAYLTQELRTGAGFIKEWQALSKDDQETLKLWAEQEQDAMGLTA